MKSKLAVICLVTFGIVLSPTVDSGLFVSVVAVILSVYGIRRADLGITLVEASIEQAAKGVERADLGIELAKASLQVADKAAQRADLGIELLKKSIELIDTSVALASVHERRMIELVASMSDIAATVPTRVSASFKEHLVYIASLIQNAGDGAEIKVLTDCADYGSFFDPENHRKVHDALIAATKRKVRVQMLVGGPVQHITQTSRYHGKSFETLLRMSDFRGLLSKYIKYLRDEPDGNFERWLRDRVVDGAKRSDFWKWLTDNDAIREEAGFSATFDDTDLKRSLEGCATMYEYGSGMEGLGHHAAFQVLLMARERYFEEQLNEVRMILRRSAAFQPSLFFWLRRKSFPQEAAFMFSQADREAFGSTMTTKDLNFTNRFSRIFNREWSKVRNVRVRGRRPVKSCNRASGRG